MTGPDETSKIATVDELVAFIATLSVEAGDDLSPFLEAMAAWLRDRRGYYENRGEDPDAIAPWRLIADALAAARTYE